MMKQTEQASSLPARIYANDANHWHPYPGEAGTVEYVRADVHAKELSQLAIESKDRELALAKLEAEVLAVKDRFEFLQKALDQAIDFAAISLIEEHEIELDSGAFAVLQEGLQCSHNHLRGRDDHTELAAYLKEAEIK